MERYLKFSFRILITTMVIIILNACNSPYKQMIKGISGTKFCLDVDETKKENDINLGSGFLILNSDKTFTIVNDSSKYSNLEGKWDLCCYSSDYENYVFKADGIDEREQSFPNIFMLVNNKKIKFSFIACNTLH